jgi:hypothetical protein
MIYRNKDTFRLKVENATIGIGVLGHHTSGIRVRRKTIECIWRRILVIHVDTRSLFLKKAGE